MADHDTQDARGRFEPRETAAEAAARRSMPPFERDPAGQDNPGPTPSHARAA